MAHLYALFALQKVFGLFGASFWGQKTCVLALYVVPRQEKFIFHPFFNFGGSPNRLLETRMQAVKNGPTRPQYGMKTHLPKPPVRYGNWRLGATGNRVGTGKMCPRYRNSVHLVREKANFSFERHDTNRTQAGPNWASIHHLGAKNGRNNNERVGHTLPKWILSMNEWVGMNGDHGPRSPTRELEVGRREARGAGTREAGRPAATLGTASIASRRSPPKEMKRKNRA